MCEADEVNILFPPLKRPILEMPNECLTWHQAKPPSGVMTGWGLCIRRNDYVPMAFFWCYVWILSLLPEIWGSQL